VNAEPRALLAIAVANGAHSSTGLLIRLLGNIGEWPPVGLLSQFVPLLRKPDPVFLITRIGGFRRHLAACLGLAATVFWIRAGHERLHERFWSPNTLGARGVPTEQLLTARAAPERRGVARSTWVQRYHLVHLRDAGVNGAQCQPVRDRGRGRANGPGRATRRGGAPSSERDYSSLPA
jgi:hypothetical protein